MDALTLGQHTAYRGGFDSITTPSNRTLRTDTGGVRGLDDGLRRMGRGEGSLKIDTTLPEDRFAKPDSTEQPARLLKPYGIVMLPDISDDRPRVRENGETTA
jgi:hypothetical protein